MLSYQHFNYQPQKLKVNEIKILYIIDNFIHIIMKFINSELAEYY